MTTKAEAPFKRCTKCGRPIEECVGCDEPDCRNPICNDCLRIEVGQAERQPHMHGG